MRPREEIEQIWRRDEANLGKRYTTSGEKNEANLGRDKVHMIKR